MGKHGETCRNGHYGWIRYKAQYDNRRERYYVVRYCYVCQRQAVKASKERARARRSVKSGLSEPLPEVLPAARFAAEG